MEFDDEFNEIKKETKEQEKIVEQSERKQEELEHKTERLIEEKEKEIHKLEDLRTRQEKFRDAKEKVFDVLKNKKFQFWVTTVILLIILFTGSWIRLQNLPILKDVTTGEYIPLALDPFYFLRLAETIVEQGSLPAIDTMRYPSMNVGFSNEILPQAIVFMYCAANVFGDYSLRYINVISPVIFFIFGLVAFFFLIYFLTKSKITALLSAGFLSVIPPYLYRTLAGFSDHEAIGMFAFFLTLLIFTLFLNFLNKKEKKLWKIIGFALILALASTFSIVSWGGGAVFIFMIIPLAFLVFWLIKTKDSLIEKKELLNYVLFYSIWIVFTILFGLLFNYPLYSIMGRFMFSATGLATPFVLLFIIIDYLMILKGRGIIKNFLKYRVLISGLITILIGSILFSLFIRNFVNLISGVINQLLNPFGTGRTGLTVAENKQPYLMDWISQTGKTIFWLFYIGIIFIGINLAKGIRKNKHKILFILSWIFFISGLLFSRISGSSLFNGENFISKAFYFIGAFIFIGYSAWLYFNNEIKIKKTTVLIAAWLIPTLIAARGAIRLFFAITPFVCFMVGYTTLNLYNYMKKSKDELIKLILIIGLVILIILLTLSFNTFMKTAINQAKYTGPSANYQWQKAMSWIRENTAEEGIFVHWWDYGYWVQYLGERPSVTDGGHANGYWDHLVGRYLLTTPFPETALSFMKTHDVSYLLIDPTDIGKYSAYSSIGSGEKGKDRFSSIPTMNLDPSQIRETSTGEGRVYTGGGIVDEDIVYEYEDNQVFLPTEKSFIGGIALEIENDGTFKPAVGLFLYNNQQVNIPLRYIYYDGKILDFEEGLDAVAYVMPSVSNSEQGVNIERMGAIMYLSPKVSKSLMAQLYLLNDPFEKYPTLTLAHAEASPIIQNLNAQGADLNEFTYYQGIQGPIKIWKIDYPSNILAREEFLSSSGEYGEFDNLEFVNEE